MLQHGDIDIITFASSSSVKYFVESLRGQGISTPQDILGQVKIACIGPITEATVKEYGLEVSGTAKEATIDSMIDLLDDNCNDCGIVREIRCGLACMNYRLT